MAFGTELDTVANVMRPCEMVMYRGRATKLDNSDRCRLVWDDGGWLRRGGSGSRQGKQGYYRWRKDPLDDESGSSGPGPGLRFE